jgi:hypothetical protein
MSYPDSPSPVAMGNILCRPRVAPSSQACSASPPMLLQQPLDIVLLISETLQPADAVALSLTCRALFRLLFSDARKRLTKVSTGWVSLLLRLERDPRVGDRYYYCQICRKLCPFIGEQDGRYYLYEQLGYEQAAYRRLRNLGYHHCDITRGMRFQLDGGFGFTFYQARLVMNRHFYGLRMGLPLSVFTVQLRGVRPSASGAPRWLQN